MNKLMQFLISYQYDIDFEIEEKYKKILAWTEQNPKRISEASKVDVQNEFSLLLSNEKFDQEKIQSLNEIYDSISDEHQKLFLALLLQNNIEEEDRNGEFLEKIKDVLAKADEVIHSSDKEDSDGIDGAADAANKSGSNQLPLQVKDGDEYLFDSVGSANESSNPNSNKSPGKSNLQLKSTVKSTINSNDESSKTGMVERLNSTQNNSLRAASLKKSMGSQAENKSFLDASANKENLISSGMENKSKSRGPSRSSKNFDSGQDGTENSTLSTIIDEKVNDAIRE
jgi:hypothetical protein